MPSESLMDVEVPTPKPISIGKATVGTIGYEKFVRFSIDHLEAPEREGRLPEKYSSLKFDEFQAIVHLPENYEKINEKLALEQELTEAETETLQLLEQIQSLKKKEDSGELISEIEAETLRIHEAAESVFSHKTKTIEVHSREDLHNPLGKMENVTLVISADLHHAPSSLRTGLRQEAYKRYGFLRTIEKVEDKIAQGDTFSDIEGDLLEHTSENDSAENVYKRFIIREASLAEFRDWTGRVIRSGKYGESQEPDTEPVLVFLGDLVTDSAPLLDVAAESTSFREMADEHDVKLIELNGNHDQDSRVPESVVMHTEMYGHRVFTQEVAGNVLIAGIDTNIESPIWTSHLVDKLGDEGAEIIRKRKEMQKMVIEKVKSHNGPVVLMGHRPSAIIRSLAVDEEVLQNSNVQRIIASHTHIDKHVVLPFTNKNGEQIVMDTVESYVKGKPEPANLYTLDIKDGEISSMRILRELKESFKRGVEARM